MSHSAIIWTVALQAPKSIEIFQARVLEWGAIAFCRLIPSWGSRFVPVCGFLIAVASPCRAQALGCVRQ